MLKFDQSSRKSSGGWVRAISGGRFDQRKGRSTVWQLDYAAIANG
ncbi:hypothetical protein ACKFKG_30860 [Phormidesmis sp. 146-35]